VRRYEQVTLPAGTRPSVVGELNVQLVLNTVAPPCMTVIVALVNDMSVIDSVHDEFGQSGAPGIGVVGGEVVTLNVTLPFFTSLAGIDWLPVTRRHGDDRPCE